MDTTADDQAVLLDELVALGEVDAIGVSCIEPDICIGPINAAVAAGIPIMTWDSDSPESDRLTYLGVDNYEGGRAAADLLVRAMGEQGTVAVLTGVPGSLNLEERIRGFFEALVQYPDIRVVAIAYSQDSAPIGVEAVEQTMRQHPDLSGWYFAGLWPLFAGRGAMPQWEAATESGELFTVAFDTLPVELEFMQDGYLHGLVGQKYWGWGYDTVTMLYDHILRDASFADFTDSGMDIVTLNNLDAMIAAWESNDFTQPLPPPFQETSGETSD
jgi:ribose transport system substrate-binding protein